jgi:hypothetical protein
MDVVKFFFGVLAVISLIVGFVLFVLWLAFNIHFLAALVTVVFALAALITWEEFSW